MRWHFVHLMESRGITFLPHWDPSCFAHKFEARSTNFETKSNFSKYNGPNRSDFYNLIFVNRFGFRISSFGFEKSHKTFLISSSYPSFPAKPICRPTSLPSLTKITVGILITSYCWALF